MLVQQHWELELVIVVNDSQLGEVQMKASPDETTPYAMPTPNLLGI